MRLHALTTLALIATIVLLQYTTTVSAGLLYVSCALSSVKFSTTSGTVLYEQTSMPTSAANSQSFTIPLTVALPSSVVVTETISNPALAAGTIRVYLNSVVASTSTSAPNPSAITVSPANTGVSETNVIRVRNNQRYEDDYFTETCDYSYVFTLLNPSSVVGDPQFSGLRGQSFQVHGIDGAVYAVISAPEYQLNSRFQFLDGPRPCAIMPSTGVKSQACWSHPGSYLGSVGLVTSSGQFVELQSGPAAEGFSSVTIDGRSIAIGETIEVTGAKGSLGHLSRNSTHEVTLQVGSFSIELESNDLFMNLRSVRVLFGEWHVLAAQRVHGLLGQTWQSRHYTGSVKEIQGEVDEYAIDEDSLDGYHFAYNRFAGVQTTA